MLDDDEELGIQIVKDLHRTGSSLFSGPNGNINQAKLKRVLLGYARWNPEVGYCQVNFHFYCSRKVENQFFSTILFNLI